MTKGIKRFRQAIKNQRDAGEGEFRLSFADVEAICKECEDENLDICVDAERQIGRYVWAFGVHAPVDADGEVVPLTTKVMYDECGREVQVNHFRLAGHNFTNRLKWRVREMSGMVLDLDHLYLRRPDSWERLEKDIGSVSNSSICAYFGWRGKPCEGCPAFIGENPCCKREAMRDVLRRTKALAERDAKGAER